MIEPDDSEDGDEWKHSAAENPRNGEDFPNKVVVNVHSNIPWSLDQWKINENESMRTDILHRGTYFSFVMGERPYVEIYSTDQFGNLETPPERIFDLGPYFNE